MGFFQRQRRGIFLMEGNGFIGPARGKPLLFPLQGKIGEPPDKRCNKPCDPAELRIDILQ